VELEPRYIFRKTKGTRTGDITTNYPLFLAQLIRVGLEPQLIFRTVSGIQIFE
jgi:hypothetical protein